MFTLQALPACSQSAALADLRYPAAVRMPWVALLTCAQYAGFCALHAAPSPSNIMVMYFSMDSLHICASCALP